MTYDANCKMKAKYFGDNYGVFYSIAFLINNKEVWESGEYHSDDIEELRDEVREELEEFGYLGNIESFDPLEWDFA